ncbi:MAG: T9SS type A sorting domain-containing protein [Cytophagales bacterium]|nr:T9SS type A sorting domain-containing protein [Cytophagales bacterium]
MKKRLTYLILVTFTFSVTLLAQNNYEAKYTATAPTIDGSSQDTCWTNASWHPIDQLWLGAQPTTADFSGKFKVRWDANKLYVLTEIVDDSLSDKTVDALTSYWEDDSWEIFVDENHSGGDHETNYNAFAYHVSKYFDVVDVGTDGAPHVYNSNLTARMTRSGNIYTWEASINVYTDAYVYGASNNPVASLVNNKIIGFAVAYSDNDGASTRDCFMGSETINAADKNVGYKTADVFGALKLVGNPLSVLGDNDGNVESNFSPNPAMDMIHLPENTEVKILDTYGHVLLRNEGKSTLDVSLLASGLYLVEITNQGKTTIKKMIK